VTVSVEVANTGSRAGEEVVQLYVKTPSAGAPFHSLEGFQRVSLGPRERKQVQFTLSPRQFSSVTAEGRRVIEPGVFELSVGGKQPGAGVSGILTGKFQITGAAKELE
jgi:beta-glucosidase